MFIAIVIYLRFSHEMKLGSIVVSRHPLVLIVNDSTVISYGSVEAGPLLNMILRVVRSSGFNGMLLVGIQTTVP